MDERKRSPVFTVLSITNPGAGDHVANIGEGTIYFKYSPFNHIRIVNNTDKTATVRINDTQTITVPADTIMSSDSRVLPAIRSIRLNYSAAATGTVTIEIWKTPNLIGAIEQRLM